MELAVHAVDIRTHGVQTLDLAGVVLANIALTIAARLVVLFQHIPTVVAPVRAAVQPHQRL